VYSLDAPTKDDLKGFWEKADKAGCLDVMTDGGFTLRDAIVDGLNDVQEVAS
jgi:hypothetical protein